MPDEPDITDPELPSVQTTEPTLPRVGETVAALEPVSPANTLDLEPVVPNTLDLEPEEVAKKMPLFDGPTKEVSSARRAALKRGDGFEGASLPNVKPVTKTPEQRQQSVKLHQFGAWILLALISSAVLVVLALLILLFR